MEIGRISALQRSDLKKSGPVHKAAVWLVIFFFPFLFLFSCGRKGNPIPPDREPAQHKTIPETDLKDQ
jgi:hypothetical protein